jgi:hypothetical protein
MNGISPLLAKTIELIEKIGVLALPIFNFPLYVFNDAPYRQNAVLYLPAQISKVYPASFLPSFHVFCKRPNPPCLSQDPDAVRPGSCGSRLADINMRSFVELQEMAGKVEVDEFCEVWLREFRDKQRQVITRGVQRPYLIRRYADALFLPELFSSSQLAIRIVDLLLDGKPRQCRSAERRGNGYARGYNRTSKACPGLRNPELSQSNKRVRPDGNNETKEANSEQKRKWQPEWQVVLLHTIKLPCAQRVVERVAA